MRDLNLTPTSKILKIDDQKLLRYKNEYECQK